MKDLFVLILQGLSSKKFNVRESNISNVCTKSVLQERPKSAAFAWQFAFLEDTQMGNYYFPNVLQLDPWVVSTGNVFFFFFFFFWDLFLDITLFNSNIWLCNSLFSIIFSRPLESGKTSDSCESGVGEN